MLNQILQSATEKTAEIKTSRQLQDVKVEFLGKSSLINKEMQKLGKALLDFKLTQLPPKSGAKRPAPSPENKFFI